ncbi:MAG: hypothetical protein KDA85_14420 [Planctomycetaceae bacterium]|nr:hypothetical protein [Planctomycetaceae bacterium]
MAAGRSLKRSSAGAESRTPDLTDGTGGESSISRENCILYLLNRRRAWQRLFRFLMKHIPQDR